MHAFLIFIKSIFKNPQKKYLQKIFKIQKNNFY
jgi:hypothetical protein